MEAAVPAIYGNGVLRLLEPLNVPEQTQVRVTVQSETRLEDLPVTEQRATVREILRQAGLLVEEQGRGDALVLLSETEREALAMRLPSDLALSDIMIEERRGSA
jgi:predicted DNA-binding antitoxin AbrB/MazE fold protein